MFSRRALFAAALLLAPAPESSLEARPRAMRFARLSIEDGLSQSVVNCILQGSTGFLWIGTQSGLNRYDGYDFAIYRHDGEDPASLAHDWILALLEDPSGDLWIGTEGGGLARWRRATDTFTTYRHDPGDPRSLSGDRVVALTWDRSGLLWVGTRDSGLNRFDPAAGTFQRFRHDPADPGSLASDKTFAVYVDRSGDLWVGTAGGLDLFDSARDAFVHHRHDPTEPLSLSDNRVRTILGDGQGVLWVGTHGGLNRFAPASARFERFRHDPADPGSLSHDWVRALLEDSDGRLWIGTDGGLNLWQEESGRFVSYHPDPADPDSLGSDQIVSIYQDRSGVLWIGPVGAGLNRWNPGTWSFPLYTSDDGAGSSNTVFAVSEDSEGGLWIGTFGGGLERLDRANGRRARYTHDPRDENSLSDDRVTALLHDRRGILWIGTVSGGLNRLDGGAIERYRHDPGKPGSLSADAVTALFEDRRDRLWIGTLGGGLDLFQDDGTFTHFRHDPADPTSLGNDRIFSLAEDRACHLWLATDGGGLNRLHPATAAFLRLRHDPRAAGSLASDELLVVHVDSGGQLWVGTKSSGLDQLERLDEETGQAVFKNYSREDGLPDETIWGIRSDPGGDLWISTNHGLARLDPRTGTVISYSSSHGLQSNEFNMGAHFSSASGELFFGGVGGLNAFFADRIRSNTTVPPVVVTSFTKLNREVSFGRPVFDVEQIDLGYRDYFFSLEVAALDFTAPQENRYRYKLEGFDTDWIEIGHRRRVSFTNLDPGRYVLRLQGSNNDGVWNEEGATLTIRVEPSPWETWWAYSLYTLALAAVVVGYVRSHRKELRREREAAEREREISHRLRKVDKLKDEFLANTSHELRTPLYGITGLAESLIDGATGELPEKTKTHLAMLVASGRRLTALVNDVLDFSKLKHHSLELDLKPVDLRALVDVVLTLSRPLVGSKDLELRNGVKTDLPSAEADENRLQQILHNLVGNAVKFTESGEVEVTAAPRDDRRAGAPCHDGRARGAPRHDRPPEGGQAKIVVSVRDTGIGISEDQQERIFEAFAQADASVERQFGGTGLGLAVARQLVELHGGTLRVESAPRKGSTFLFDLPISEEQPAEAGAVEPQVARLTEVSVLGRPPSGGTATADSPARSTEEAQAATERVTLAPLPGDGASVLVVDDEPVVRQVLTNQLTARGFRVTPAASGAEALRLLAERAVDLVLLDVMMPRMSGFEVCRRVRERYPLEELPVIFLTARNQVENLVVGLAAGANDYLPKPVSKSELLARVNNHLELLTVHRSRAEEVKVLRGLLPICSSCKKIRDDQGYWTQLEVYIDANSEAVFTHGICPDCIRELYGEIDLSD